MGAARKDEENEWFSFLQHSLRSNARAARQHVQRHALAQQNAPRRACHRGHVRDRLKGRALLDVPLHSFLFPSPVGPVFMLAAHSPLITSFRPCLFFLSRAGGRGGGKGGICLYRKGPETKSTRNMRGGKTPGKEGRREKVRKRGEGKKENTKCFFFDMLSWPP